MDTFHVWLEKKYETASKITGPSVFAPLSQSSKQVSQGTFGIKDVLKIKQNFTPKQIRRDRKATGISEMKQELKTKETLNDSNFVNAIDFFRETSFTTSKIIYHHIGIYAYDVQTLNKYVNLKRTQNEIERSLEQMRAIDNNINIHVALSSSLPLGVDTKEEFVAVKKSMEYKG